MLTTKKRVALVLVDDTFQKYAFLSNKIENNNGSGIINLLIQVCKIKEYDCNKANHGIEMISKKKLEKSDYDLVVKINQI